jgi:hypothetical protein
MDLSERPTGRASSRRHPWETARFHFFQRLLAEHGASPAHLLDAGAGDGWFAHELVASLPATSSVVCWDAYYTEDTLAALRREAGPRLRFTAQRPAQRFDTIMLLDVLEHVEHDTEFLTTLVSDNLETHGTALISVPAWQALFTTHDTRLRHYRRYRPDAVARLVERCGLTILRQGGLFHSLLLPRAAGKLLELLRPPKPDQSPPSLSWSGGPSLTRLVTWALARDGELSFAAERVGVRLPGLSWWALCKKS